jgi:hypothetical protein
MDAVWGNATAYNEPGPIAHWYTEVLKLKFEAECLPVSNSPEEESAIPREGNGQAREAAPQPPTGNSGP